MLHDVACHAGGPPLPPGISGIAALNSSLGGGVNPNLVNPNVAPVVDPSTVPFQEGWVKIRGIPPGTGKKELCAFFSVSPPISASLQHVVIVTDDALRPDDVYRKDF